ncbi:MAG: trypsin-like peptidase domain-containing protein [Magnetococcales bacterium]|nr:trypsin-like peptidase domain-containing protein [Magnetococcales bacterium]
MHDQAKSALLYLCIFILFSFGCSKTPFGKVPKFLKIVENSYVSLNIWNPWLIEFNGSAVIIYDGVAISNRHLLEKAVWTTGTFAKNSTIKIDNIVLIESLDLAVFDIPCGIGRPMPNRENKRIQNGQTIYALGTTYDNPVIQGVVMNNSFSLHHSDVHIPKAKKELATGRSVTNGFLYRGDTSKGFSGGPIIDQSGRLVGINQGRITKFFSDSDFQRNKSISNEKIYGFAYHIGDVIAAIKDQTPEILQRCSISSGITN